MTLAHSRFPGMKKTGLGMQTLVIIKPCYPGFQNNHIPEIILCEAGCSCGQPILKAGLLVVNNVRIQLPDYISTEPENCLGYK